MESMECVIVSGHCQTAYKRNLLSCHVKTMHGLNNIIDGDYIPRIRTEYKSVAQKIVMHG